MIDSSARNSAGMRLPPLEHDCAKPNVNSGASDRGSSGESVTSAGKVSVDLKRSPAMGRFSKVADVAS